MRASCVVAAVAYPSVCVTLVPAWIAMPIAFAWRTAALSRHALESRQTLVAKGTSSVAFARAKGGGPSARRVEVGTTVNRAVGTKPAQIAGARVRRRALTVVARL